MREQMVCQQDRLGGLQVGFAGHDGARVCGGLLCQRTDHVEHTGGDPAHRVAQPHPKQRGHLVVARAPGPQSAAQVRSDPVDQAPLQRGMHVLVGDQRAEAAVGDVLGEAVQAGEQPVALLLGEQPGPKQHHGVRPRRGEVVGASTQSKWVDLLSAASASDGPPANRPPHSDPSLVLTFLWRADAESHADGRGGAILRLLAGEPSPQIPAGGELGGQPVHVDEAAGGGLVEAVALVVGGQVEVVQRFRAAPAVDRDVAAV